MTESRLGCCIIIRSLKERRRSQPHDECSEMDGLGKVYLVGKRLEIVAKNHAMVIEWIVEKEGVQEEKNETTAS